MNFCEISAPNAINNSIRTLRGIWDTALIDGAKPARHIHLHSVATTNLQVLPTEPSIVGTNKYYFSFCGPVAHLLVVRKGGN